MKLLLTLTLTRSTPKMGLSSVPGASRLWSGHRTAAAISRKMAAEVLRQRKACKRGGTFYSVRAPPSFACQIRCTERRLMPVALAIARPVLRHCRLARGPVGIRISADFQQGFARSSGLAAPNSI
jgi:hypothetical protein